MDPSASCEKSEVSRKIKIGQLSVVDGRGNFSQNLRMIQLAAPKHKKGSYAVTQWQSGGFCSVINKTYTRSLWWDRLLFWGLWLVALATAFLLSHHVQLRLESASQYLSSSGNNMIAAPLTQSDVEKLEIAIPLDKEENRATPFQQIFLDSAAGVKSLENHDHEPRTTSKEIKPTAAPPDAVKKKEYRDVLPATLSRNVRKERAARAVGKNSSCADELNALQLCDFK